MDYLFVATDFDVLTYVRGEEGWRRERRSLAGKKATCIAASDGTILAGTTEGIFRSADLGQTWWPANEGLTTRHVRTLAYDPQDPNRVLAGTQPAGIFVSHDGSLTWQACEGVDRLRDAHGWRLPYAPEAGCVRDFAFQGDHVYAGVEQGGLLHSTNRGDIWQLAGGSSGAPRAKPGAGEIHPDVHGVITFASPVQEIVFAATGGGLYQSVDAGASWRRLHRDYVRAVWVDPNQAEWMILGPAEGVDRGGRIEMSTNGGETWQSASQGLAAPWAEHMVERFVAYGDQLTAVLSNGEIHTTPIDQLLRWEKILTDVESANALVFVSV